MGRAGLSTGLPLSAPVATGRCLTRLSSTDYRTRGLVTVARTPAIEPGPTFPGPARQTCVPPRQIVAKGKGQGGP